MTDEVKVPDGFTSFDGVKQPVEDHEEVEVICRDGVKFISRASEIAWWLPRLGASYEIIAYRVVTP